MFIIKGIGFLMLDISITIMQDLMEFYHKKLIYDLYTHVNKKLAQNVENDLEYINV